MFPESVNRTPRNKEQIPTISGFSSLVLKSALLASNKVLLISTRNIFLNMLASRLYTSRAEAIGALFCLKTQSWITKFFCVSDPPESANTYKPLPKKALFSMKSVLATVTSELFEACVLLSKPSG